MLNEALKYLNNGISVIPVKGDKRPLVLWEPFQKELATEAQTYAWFGKDGLSTALAVVTGSLSGYVVIDIDDLDMTKIWDLIPDPAIIPTAHTPSGGLHLYFKAPVNPIGNNVRVVPGCDFRGEGGYVVAPPSPGYSWLPGQSIFEIEAPELPQKYLDYITGSTEKPRIVNPEGPVIPQGQRNDHLFHIANRLFRGGASPDEVRQYLMVYAKACNPPLSDWEISIILDSASKRDGARSGSLAQEVRDWIATKDTTWRRQDLYIELNITTEYDKKNLSKIIERLQADGIIEKVGKRYGEWRRVIRGFDVLNVIEAGDAPMEISFPLGINSIYVNVEKTVVVVAGSPNSGKSAFCLNFAMLNRNNYSVTYITSEMGAAKLKRRLKKFELPLQEWAKVRFIELNDNYLDAVEPDQITIIDFLEVHDEFWKVSGWINAIFRKLTTGMCLIALQKNTNTKTGTRDTGRGGDATLEKPSLYLAMDHGIIKVVKCKEWPEGFPNPNGYTREFKLVGGCKFIAESPWGVEAGEVRK